MNEQKQNELVNLPACAAEFINIVIKKMRYRKKVREDVRAELKAHFEDELRGCKTDEEKEQKAKKLIEDFGDAKLLAVLLRRAKKRCRPLWRTVAARTFQTIGILFLCLVIYLVWFFAGKPAITTEYIDEMNRIVRPTADDSLNAAPLYEKASQMFVGVPDNFVEFLEKQKQSVSSEEWNSKEWFYHKRLYEEIPEYTAKPSSSEKQTDEEPVIRIISSLLGKRPNDVTPQQKELIEKWITTHQEAINLLIEASQKPYCWTHYKSDDGGVTAIQLQNLGALRRLIWALRWRSWLNIKRGQINDALSDMIVCFHVGRHMTGNKLQTEQLVGDAFQALSLGFIRDILSKYEIDSASLAHLQSELEGSEKGRFMFTLKAEKLLKYDTLQRCFTEDRLGGGHLSPTIAAAFLAARFMYDEKDDTWFDAFTDMFFVSGQLVFTQPNKQQTLKSLNQLYEYLETLLRKTPAQLHAESDDVDKHLEELLGKNVFLKAFVPPLYLTNIVQISHRFSADVNATLAIIAILRYKQNKEDFPESLDELTAASYLKKLPMDPFSDKPLVYKKTEDSFTLYSVGLNFTDDGGKLEKNDKGKSRIWGDQGDAVFWPVNEQNW